MMENNVFYIALSFSVGWHLLWAAAVKIVMPLQSIGQEFAVINFWGPILEKTDTGDFIPVPKIETREQGPEEMLPDNIMKNSGQNNPVENNVIEKNSIPLEKLVLRPSSGVTIDLSKDQDVALTQKFDNMLEQRPVIFKPELPVYPEWARSLGGEFEIELKFLVLPDGTVGKVEKIKSSGYPELDEIGIRYMRKWKFMPLSKEVPQENQWGEIRFNFRLK